MSRTVDGVLVAWGERTSWKGKGGKKGKDIKFKNGKLTGGNKQSKGSGSGAAIRSEMSPKQAKAKLGRTLKKSPEVMVKITGAGKTVEKIKAHLDYISRDDKLKLENEEGREVDAEETINRFTEKGAKIEREGEGARSKSAFHIVLSMPPGTDPQGVKDAAREFAKTELAGHQYVFVRHDDEKHPHVHIAVKAVSDRTGERLNPRKADLQRWRETFADKLNERGIDANATPTWARGNFNRGRRTRSHHALKNKGELDKPRIKAPEHEEKNNTRMKALYEDVAKALAVTGSNDDKKMALDTVSFLKERTTLASSGNSKIIEPNDASKNKNVKVGKDQTNTDKER